MTMLNKMFARTYLDTKDFAEESDVVTVSGIASTPSTDRHDDIVEPKGAIFKTPMPLIWQHDSHKPVGRVTFAKPDKDGIPFTAEIPRIKEAGTLKDRIDEAIQSLKYGLVAAVSIGFNPIEYEFLDNGGVHFKKWEWLELSLVTIPANRDAQIELVKSIDRNALAALGQPSGLDLSARLTPGVTGSPRKAIQLIPRRVN